MSALQDTKGGDWKGIAENYKNMTTEVGKKPIGVMLERANALLPFSQADGVLDNGCGPGPVMDRLLKDYQIPDTCALTCADFSDPMIEQVQQVKEAAVKENSKSPWSRVRAEVQNAMDLQKIESSSMTHVTAGWVYFMVPDPQKALSESRRVLKEGGVLSCSAWEDSQWMQLMSMVPRVRPEKQLPELPTEWRNVDLIKGELEKAGFRDVESHRVHTEMKVEDMSKMVDFFVTKLPHLVKATEDFSEDEIAKLKEIMVDEGRKMESKTPGILTGTTLVAVGRK